MKQIKISLTKSGSLKDAIRELEAYQKSLKSRSEIFVRRLAEIGIPIIDSKMASAKGDSDPSHYTHITIHSFGDYSEAILTVEGRDILFIEFGAGIHYNGAAGSSPHPKGAELGYTIGSYGYGQGANDFWFYTAETGETVMSHGTKATMPVLSASREIQKRVKQIAKEVFVDGVGT